MISSKVKKSNNKTAPGIKLQYQYDSDGKEVGVFIPIKEWNFIIKNYKDLDQPKNSKQLYKTEILKGLKHAINEVEMDRRGVKKLQNAKDFINEMRKELQ